MTENKNVDFLTGNEAIALAVKLAKVQIIPAYPITPQSPVVEKLAEYVSNGDLKAEYVEMDGEHSCFQFLGNAASTGCRVFSATCGPGLAYAHETLQVLHVQRQPTVIAVPNRSHMSLFPDLSDSICESTTGFIQFFCETPQECLDTVLMAYKIAEDHRVLMPMMVLYDGYVTSHTGNTVQIPSQEEVDNFLPPRDPYPATTVDPSKPPSIPIYGFAGSGDPHHVEMDHELAMQNVKSVSQEVNDEFFKLFGRRYGNGLVDEIGIDGADAALLTMSSHTGTARTAVKELRSEGKNVGIIKLKSFRPFPNEDLIKACSKVKAVGVVERDETNGSGCGEVFKELRSTLYDLPDKPKTLNFILGISGEDITVPQLKFCAENTLKVAESDLVEKTVMWAPELPIERKARRFQF